MTKHFLNILFLILLGSVVLGFGIGRRDLWAPDEPRFGHVTREILQRNEPFVLYVNNEHYSDKPPLYMWMAAVFSGFDSKEIHNAAVRLPSVIGGVMGLVITYLLGFMMFGSKRAGFISAIILMTTFQYLYQANRAQLDMLMSGFSYLAVFAFWLAENSKKPGRATAWWGLFWIAAGLGTLAKGPPALIAPLGGIIFYRLWMKNPERALWTSAVWFFGILSIIILSKISFLHGIFPTLAIIGFISILILTIMLCAVPEWKEDKKRLLATLARFCIGLVIFAAVVGIWFIPYHMKAPASGQDTLVTQTLTRYFEGISHAEWIGFYIETFPHNLIPWMFFIISGLLFMWKKDLGMPPRPRAFLLSWFLFTLLFFSLSPGKRDQYLLPCYPALALICGWLFEVLLARDGAPRKAWVLPAKLLTWATLILGIVMFIVAILLHTNTAEKMLQKEQALGLLTIKGSFWVPPIALLACAWASWRATKRMKIYPLIVAPALLMMVINLWVNGWILPSINDRKSGRVISDQIMKLRESPDTPVVTYRFYRTDFHVYGDFYIKEIQRTADKKDTYLLEYLNQPRQVLVLYRENDLEKAMKNTPELPVRILFKQKIGDRDLILADNGKNK